MNEDGKKVIAILTDRSFNIGDIGIPMNYIHGIISNNLEAIFVYGMNTRIDSHVENYSKVYNIPKENLIKFEFDKSKPETIGKSFLEVLGYSPDVIHIFRDHQNQDTNMLVTKCKTENILNYTISSLNQKWCNLDSSIKANTGYYKRSVRQ